MGCSTTLLTDKNGSDIGQFLYTPFGEMWVEEASTVDISNITRFFTNQQYDKESGLYYYNARYYDPHLGSFITPDPAMANYNHYSYCSANPIKYTDPTGLLEEEDDDDDEEEQKKAEEARKAREEERKYRKKNGIGLITSGNNAKNKEYWSNRWANGLGSGQGQNTSSGSGGGEKGINIDFSAKSALQQALYNSIFNPTPKTKLNSLFTEVYMNNGLNVVTDAGGDELLQSLLDNTCAGGANALLNWAFGKKGTIEPNAANFMESLNRIIFSELKMGDIIGIKPTPKSPNYITDPRKPGQYSGHIMVYWKPDPENEGHHLVFETHSKSKFNFYSIPDSSLKGNTNSIRYSNWKLEGYYRF